MTAEPTQLTREELHRQVWTVPGVHLAARFGLSDTGLAKICRKLDVPRPPPGWWAKKAAGKKVRSMPLPDLRSGTPDRIRITPTPERTDGLREDIGRTTERLGGIAVPAKLTRPHPLIAGWLADRRERQLRARQETEPWRRKLYHVPDLTQSERRRHCVLHALFRALERQGAIISETERWQLTATLEGEDIPFELREKQRQISRPMTADEKRWAPWISSGMKKELEPTGCFLFTISARSDEPVRKQWLESEGRPIDAMLPAIVATFVVLAPVLAERSRQRAEAAQKFAEAQRLAEEERQRRREDDNRWRRFLDIAAAWKEAAMAREFIAALRAGEVGGSDLIEGRSVAEWIDWAEQRAHALDAAGGKPATLFADVGAVHSWTRLD